MPGDPTSLNYDEAIRRVEWGVVVTESGEYVRMPEEAIARVAAAVSPRFMLIKREVIYHPWRMMPQDDLDAEGGPDS